jgi:hypothetical protein
LPAIPDDDGDDDGNGGGYSDEQSNDDYSPWEGALHFGVNSVEHEAEEAREYFVYYRPDCACISSCHINKIYCVLYISVFDQILFRKFICFINK